MPDLFVVEFEEGEVDGLHGPFRDREAAHTWASLHVGGRTASWIVRGLDLPTNGDARCGDYPTTHTGRH